MIYRVTSPVEADESPADYEEDGLVRWVDEVFMEGYKKGEGEPFPSLEECLELLVLQGYGVEEVE